MQELISKKCAHGSYKSHVSKVSKQSLEELFGELTDTVEVCWHREDVEQCEDLIRIQVIRNLFSKVNKNMCEIVRLLGIALDADPQQPHVEEALAIAHGCINE